MNKLRIYILNGFFSSMIGMAIEVIWTILNHKNAIDLAELFESMAKGAFIGTISLFVLFHVFMRFKNKPVAGFISNFTIVAVLTTIIAILDFIETSSTSVMNRWILVFVVAEILGFILTAVWYRQITTYNDKLKKKKASIIELE